MLTIVSIEFSLGFYLIDIFSRCLSFYHTNCRNKESKTTHIHNHNKYIFNTLTNSKFVVVISNTSIKNNIAISITHVYSFSNSIKKKIHYTVNIMTTEAKLFAIRYSIYQAIQIPGISHIIIIMNVIYMAYQSIFTNISE